MDKQISNVEGLFQALGDVTRLRILGLLLAGETCVCDIHETLRVSQPKTSRHLAYLRRSGLVATRRQGLWVYYRLTDTSDAVLSTIQLAVTHVLGHLDIVRRDVARLQKKTGCCLPEPSDAPACVCCSSAGQGNESRS